MGNHHADLLFEQLRVMELPPGSYAVFGSGPLAIRGLIAEVGDLDVIVREDAWEKVMHQGDVTMHGDHPMVDLGNGLTFGRSWAYGDFDIEGLIDATEITVGLPFVRLESVAEYKRIAARPKDLDHLALMRKAGLIEGRETTS